LQSPDHDPPSRPALRASPAWRPTTVR
jgi:hypothetical protein